MMNVNELKACIEGLLAAESDTVPRDAVVRIKEMVEKLPTSTVTTTAIGGAVPAKMASADGTVIWTYPTTVKLAGTDDGAGGG